ncbi:UNVERIFIED_CONTAM: Retrovirus-related Pol polyprotein from type-2 retrotransposable element R2DM [Sesamum radiatum]|uniref:Retrovirus-related Pol polyprotein from type-2 retrotransposable element R2DM n=1 Tax=Sesamum radiatum TaxID=300843 RepID=A0AAW2JLE1_SESRA
MIRDGSKRWSSTAVGYFLGKKPYFPLVKEFACSIWPRVRDVTATSNGFFFFQFATTAAMEEVIEGGPWLFHGQTIVLQKWEPGMVLRKLQHTQVPAWIKMRHLPVELWTPEGLSVVASGIGKPLYPDSITRACTRLDFARVCIMLDITSTLPKHVVIMVPKEDGSESACKVDIEYEWLPPKCTTCISLGHHSKECPSTRPRHPPAPLNLQPDPKLAEESRLGHSVDVVETMIQRVLLAALLPEWMINAAFWNVRGLNRRDHQGLQEPLEAVGPLVSNDQWLTTWPSTSYLSLNARTSDHSPLVLRGNATDRTVGMFRFDNYLARSTEFIPSVQRVWQHRIVGTAMYEVTRKLKALKPIFRAQRRKKGDLSNNVSLAAGFLETAQLLLATDRHCPVLLHLEFCCKLAVFDIDESKAPGPDGYSAGFFKAAWPVIGGEVTQAIRDFFQTENAGDPGYAHQPFSERVRAWRAIGDNILLAQELFSGYNQKHLPPRCALKVDLRKAYDTVEWDFLRAVLMLFGFPEQFIQWIVVCVTTPSFSVCLNGAPHGFFRGARGLRQGDPMSPFLFVLVMEVLTLILQQKIEQNGGFSFHWRCDRIQLFQLGFADDLLLFSKADPNSVSLFKEGLTTFAELSGLQANLHKSHLILSSSAAPLRATLLTILGFQEGHLPLRYLGLPY